MIPTHRDASAFRELASLLTGQLVLPQNAAYEDIRQLWSGSVKTRPAALVRCATEEDVMHTVRWAQSHGMALAVRGGGHDFVGRALCEDGVVIDCSPMRAVTIDAKGRVASIQGGTTAGDLINEAQKFGLATTTGSVS